LAAAAGCTNRGEIIVSTAVTQIVERLEGIIIGFLLEGGLLGLLYLLKPDTESA